jgi:hypothetical protein
MKRAAAGFRSKWLEHLFTWVVPASFPLASAVTMNDPSLVYNKGVPVPGHTPACSAGYPTALLMQLWGAYGDCYGAKLNLAKSYVDLR